ncbi:MAG TPA: AraC family transcriptional regulator, partial [Acidimicrobiales bacterium]|nr:AraC family transcriptional regulator [Acidimicrobiales bacterium]
APAGPSPSRAAERALSGFVERVWRARAPLSGLPLLVLPDGGIDVVTWGDEVRIAGPDTRPVLEVTEPGTVITALRLRPGAASPLFGMPARELRDQRVSIDAVWGPEGRRLRDEVAASAAEAVPAVLQRAFRCRIERGAPAPDALAGELLRRLQRDDGTPAIAALAAELGLSERHLLRRSCGSFGYGPKTLARILRFQRMIRDLHRKETPIAQLAALHGYADQAHLTHESQLLSGLTPAELRRGGTHAPVSVSANPALH